MRCDVCGTVIEPNVPWWRYPAGCDWGVYTSSTNASITPEMALSDVEAADNPCGLRKNVPPPPQGRSVLGGVMIAVFPCGTVADVDIVPRCETRRQVRTMLASLRAVRV